jgi:hypothetical protein
MTYRVTNLWSVPNGNFNSNADVWPAFTNNWTAAQIAAVQAINDQYVLESSITWNPATKQVTIIADFANEADKLKQEQGWQDLSLSRPTDWIYISSTASVI